jgi:hypothetical protein
MVNEVTKRTGCGFDNNGRMWTSTIRTSADIDARIRTQKDVELSCASVECGTHARCNMNADGKSTTCTCNHGYEEMVTRALQSTHATNPQSRAGRVETAI